VNVNQSGPAKHPARWTRAEVCVRGVRLSYIERELVAPVVGVPVLMLHGLVAGADCFRRLGEELPPERRVVALDLPGGGYSDRPRGGDVSFRGTAELVAEVMTALGMERAVVVGHSYGGAITLELVTWRPELVDAMILISPAHPFSKREDPLVRFYLSTPGRWFAGLLPRVPRRLMLETFRRMPGDRRDVGYEQIQPYMQTLRHPGTIGYVLRMLKSWKSDMERLGRALRERRTEVPALLLWGELDPIVPESTGAYLMQHMELCEQATLRGVGHLPNDERPEECGALIRTWLIWRETHWKYAQANRTTPVE
jgi:pimeloyl-ACP methyl ester carboxylesterase